MTHIFSYIKIQYTFFIFYVFTYLTMNCTKIITIFGASLLILAGLVGSILGIFLFSSFRNSILQNLRTIISVLFIILSLLLTMTGSFGLYGINKENKCFLNIFWVLLIFWILLFIICGVLALELPQRLFNQGCNSKNIEAFVELNFITHLASTKFCKSNCKCYLQNSPSLAYNYSATDTTLSIQIQQCENWNTSIYDSVLQQLEVHFSCSGWCTGTEGDFFKFSDVNAGRPIAACFDSFYNWFADYGRIIYITCFVICSIILPLLLIIYIHTQSVRQGVK